MIVLNGAHYSDMDNDCGFSAYYLLLSKMNQLLLLVCVKNQTCMLPQHSVNFRSFTKSRENNLSCSLHALPVFFFALCIFGIGCGCFLCWGCELRLIVVNLVIWFTNIKVIEFHLNFRISVSLIYMVLWCFFPFAPYFRCYAHVPNERATVEYY